MSDRGQFEHRSLLGEDEMATPEDDAYHAELISDGAVARERIQKRLHERTQNMSEAARRANQTAQDSGESETLMENLDRKAREEALAPLRAMLGEHELTPEQREVLLEKVQARFEANMDRHTGLEWKNVQAKLEASPEKLWSLNRMEETGGEPDVVEYDEKTNEFIFFDCSQESPEGRRNVVYDREAQDWLNENRPYETYNGNAVGIAEAMGIEILDEEQYRDILQKKGKFDLKTWSWLKTHADIRKTGRALNGYRNDNGVFVLQHNAPYQDDYGAFRGSLRV